MFIIIISSLVYFFFPSFHTGNVMIALYALGMDMTYIWSIAGVTNIKQQPCNFITFILVIRLIVSQLIVKIVTFIIDTI